MVQMAMIPMRIRTRCQDSSSRDWSVDIQNVIITSPFPVLRTSFDFPLRAVDLFDIPREGAMVAEDEVD